MSCTAISIIIGIIIVWLLVIDLRHSLDRHRRLFEQPHLYNFYRPHSQDFTAFSAESLFNGLSGQDAPWARQPEGTAGSLKFGGAILAGIREAPEEVEGKVERKMPETRKMPKESWSGEDHPKQGMYV